MTLSLQKRILLFTLLVLVLTIAGNTWFAVASFRSSYREGILRRCETLAAGLAGHIEGRLEQGLALPEIAGLAERCQEIAVQDPEIAYCVVESQLGRPLFHSTAPDPLLAQAEFLNTVSPQGTLLATETLGQVYDQAIPLFDRNDRLVGRVRVGFSATVLDRLVDNYLYQALALLGLGAVAMFLLVAFFARRDLIAPIRKLSAMAEAVAGGNFQPEQPRMRTRELVDLGQALQGMAHSLRQRDEKIRSNYRELEQTNLELQSSYEHLEIISSELGRSREMYRSLLEDASDAILVCDEDDEILMVNKAAQAFFGNAKREIEGCDYFAFLAALSCPDVDRQRERYRQIRAVASLESEIRFVRPTDGKALVGWALISAVAGRDRKRLVQIVVRDITREEETRQGLQQAARELERLNQMKNTFLGLASHELKTPLTIIMGYLELLETEFSEQVDDEARDMLQQITKATERLAEIVRDMLDVSMLDDKTIDLVSRDVEAGTLIRRAVDKTRPHLVERRQTVSMELAEALPTVRCDLERMIQALVNLLGNAIKFTPDGGRITISARLVKRARIPEKFSRDGDGDQCRMADTLYPYLEIAIADQGIGIALEDQEAIFEKFYEVGRVEGHSSGKVAFRSRGAGLGLTIARGVVAMHGGTVWVESPGHDPRAMPGSTFFILLPAVGMPGR